MLLGDTVGSLTLNLVGKIGPGIFFVAPLGIVLVALVAIYIMRSTKNSTVIQTESSARIKKSIKIIASIMITLFAFSMASPFLYLPYLIAFDPMGVMWLLAVPLSCAVLVLVILYLKNKFLRVALGLVSILIISRYFLL